MAFTMTDLRVPDHRDPRSRCADPGVHDRPIRAFTMRRNQHPGAFRADAGRQARAALCDETGRAVALICGTSSVTKRSPCEAPAGPLGARAGEGVTVPRLPRHAPDREPPAALSSMLGP